MSNTRPTTGSALRSEFELFEQADILVAGAGGGTLKANDVARRGELIKAVRGGEHVELTVRARTFRQKDGVPNKNFLRFKTEKLGAFAKSFVGMPLLLDHNTYEQKARIGTISASESEDQGNGWTAILQTLQVVKPDAVISILDGTLDRYSIGWRSTGPVLCTVHRTDLLSRGRCNCWPGDRVEVDGKEEIVEYEFQSAAGKETSGVNDPAVNGTRNEDVQQALAAELGIDRDRDRHQGDPAMNFTRLAAILGIAALSTVTDEDSAVRAVEGLKRDKLAAETERDTARTELKTAKDTAALAIAKALKTQIDAEINAVYKAGKLTYGRDPESGASVPSPREARLRRIAKEDGLDALKAEIKEMVAIVPLNKRKLDDGDGGELADEVSIDDALTSAAEQLGLDPKDLRDYANRLQEG